MRLSARLEKLLWMTENGAPYGRLVDVGTDHGFVPVEALRRGLAESAVASDVKRGPLDRAREHVDAAGLADRIRLLLADGIPETEMSAGDLVVIAGMGGPLICRILSAAAGRLAAGQHLLLSPQSKTDEFRDYLCENGFVTAAEACVCDEDKYYFIIDAVYTPGAAAKMLLPHERAFGRLTLFDKESAQVRRSLICRQISGYDELIRDLPDEGRAGQRKRELCRRRVIALDALKEYNTFQTPDEPVKGV